jgi:hypothetical protein
VGVLVVSASPKPDESTELRIILAGPPKTGNVWVESILAKLYDLEILKGDDIPEKEVEYLRRFVKEGSFRASTIFHQHYRPTDELFEVLESVACTIVAVLRNPYDTFVSLYYYIQNFSQSFVGGGGPGTEIIGKPIDHPDVFRYLRDPFRWNLLVMSEWAEASDRAILVRYEDLHREAFSTVKLVVDRIAPASDIRIRLAIEASRADRLRSKNKHLAKHIRSATVGDWRNHLNEAHLDVFRNQHADLIKRMGYEVV